MSEWSTSTQVTCVVCKIGYFCLRPDSEAVAEGLGRHIWPSLPSPPLPTLLNFRKSPMTHDMNGMNWHEWHELTWIDMNDMNWHELTWMTWIDMNEMNWHELTWQIMKLTLNDGRRHGMGTYLFSPNYRCVTILILLHLLWLSRISILVSLWQRVLAGGSIKVL